jgi:hypothetical protein
MMLRLLACLILCFPVLAQSAPKSIVFTDTSNVSAKDILKAINKECPNVSITNDAAKSDYTLDATLSAKATISAKATKADSGARPSTSPYSTAME